jgi:hypothetical protein
LFGILNNILIFPFALSLSKGNNFNFMVRQIPRERLL